MENKLSDVLNSGQFTKFIKMSNDKYYIVVKRECYTSMPSMCHFGFIGVDDSYACSDFEDNGYSSGRGYDKKPFIVAVYSISYTASFNQTVEAIKKFEENEKSGASTGYSNITKLWETPKEVEIAFDQLLNSIDASSLLEWLMTPDEIAKRVNDLIKNGDEHSKYFLNELKSNIPGLENVEEFYVEREPGNCW